MKKIEGGITAAKGFMAASAAAGIKYKDRKDMAVIYSQVPCQAAGTFTTNVVKAAPVKWDQKLVKESGEAQAVVINAGIANACTGAEGYSYCKATAQAAAEGHRSDWYAASHGSSDGRNQDDGAFAVRYPGKRN